MAEKPMFVKVDEHEDIKDMINLIRTKISESKEVLAKHYEEHVERDFYEPLLEFMSSGRVMAILLQGENAVNVAREINGATNPAKARPCTIRYLYGSNVQQNAVHGAASTEDAKREIEIWFGKA